MHEYNYILNINLTRIAFLKTKHNLTSVIEMDSPQQFGSPSALKIKIKPNSVYDLNAITNIETPKLGHSLPGPQDFTRKNHSLKRGFFDPVVDEFKSTFSSSSKTIQFIVLVVCIGLSHYQVGSLLVDYLGFPTRVTVSTDVPKTWRIGLPGLTLCSHNRIEFDAAKKKIPQLEPALKSIDADTELDEVKKKKKKITTLLHYMSNYYKKYNISQQLVDGPRLEYILEDLKCDKDIWHEDSMNWTCQYIDMFITAQGRGNCITLFHEGANERHAEMVSVETIKQETIIDKINDEDTKIKLKEFVPNEIVKLRINFYPENYTDIRIEAGGELMVHDRRTVPYLASLSYTIRPGRYYEFYLKKTQTLSMPPPYTTNCRHYFNENREFYTEKKVIEVSHPLSRVVSRLDLLIHI